MTDLFNTHPRTGHTAAVPLGQSVIPAWMEFLSFQQQSVLLLALRGPDGVRKHHPAKLITIAYRGPMLRAAERQRFLYRSEAADTIMSMDVIWDRAAWTGAIKAFFQHVDELPHHYVSHIAHAAQIIGYKHPDMVMRDRWRAFYVKWCDDLHVEPESEDTMDARLGDWGTAKARLRAMDTSAMPDREPTAPPALPDAPRIMIVDCPNCSATGNHTIGGGRDNSKDTCTRCGGSGRVAAETGQTPEASYQPA